MHAIRWRGFRVSYILVPVSALLVGACQRPTGQQGPPSATEVAVAKPVVMPIVEWDEYTGRLDAIDSVEVRARVSGYLQSTHFQEGQVVKQGDLLAIVDPRPFEAALKSAEARLEEANAKHAEAKFLLSKAIADKSSVDARLVLANRRLARTRALVRTNVVTQEEYDILESEQLQATAAVEAAKAEIESAKAGIATASAAIETASASVESAELDLGYARIRAPISGRISRRYVTEGNLISGGASDSTLITTIVSLNPIHVYFDANEQEFLKYVRLAQEGKRASSRDVKNPVFVALVDEQGFPHTGHMDFVDNRVDPNTGTMRGRAILSNDSGLLTPGLFVKLRLPGSGRYDAVLIPDSAIGSDQSERFVYIVKDDTVERREVSLGPKAHGLRIIRDGLTGSETIITRGLQRVFPGAEVATVPEQVEPESSQLPDDYEPVPEAQWLSRKPAEVPEGIPANAATVNELPADDVPDEGESIESEQPEESE